MVLAVAVALVAAATYALATALLHRSAQLVEIARPGRIPSGDRSSGAAIWPFVTSNLRHPLWIVGMLVEAVGFSLHALALHSGPIILVQPLLVTGLIFALPIRQLLERRRPDTFEIAWATVLSAGLVLFLLSAAPGQGRSQPPDTVPTIVAVVLVGAGMLASGVLGTRSGGRIAAPVLGFGAGLGFAAVAGLLKAVTAEMSRYGLAALSHWPFWALFPSGIGGLLLDQLAFRVAPLRYSLPTLSTVDPIVSVLIGVSVFDEPFSHSPLALGGELAGMVLIVVPIVALTRREPDQHPLAPASEPSG